jgi:NAD(P)-dependent dehydrogenase (short-subunit alcohol dehydrogenase family)
LSAFPKFLGGRPYTAPMSGWDPLAGFRQDGRVALVTGASSGLGARFARVLDAAGARVVVTARRADRLAALAAELVHEPVVVPADLREPGAPERVVAEAVAATGRIDVVVNNAGVSDSQPALDETTPHFADIVHVNLTTGFGVVRDAARAMVDTGHGGSVINVASIYGLVGVGAIPQASYAASKGALVAMTRELAVQWARHGIRVNALAPGWFDSEMTAVMFHGEEAARSLDWVARRTPLKRPGRPDELDGALLYLAGDASSYVTGHTLTVDGGWTAV